MPCGTTLGLDSYEMKSYHDKRIHGCLKQRNKAIYTVFLLWESTKKTPNANGRTKKACKYQ